MPTTRPPPPTQARSKPAAGHAQAQEEQGAPLPDAILDALALAHSSWHGHLLDGLRAMARADAAYLPSLAADHYLPTEQRLFAAFGQPKDAVRYVLVGEGP